MRGLLAAACVVVAAACGGGGSGAVAELTKAAGPVDRQEGDGPWRTAKLGAEFFLGDAARTASGPAELRLAAGAVIAMQPSTILRFGASQGKSKISVELGTIDLTGTGSYGLDVGDVKLSKGGLRITARGDGSSSIRLDIGEAQVTRLGGETLELVVGVEVQLKLDDVTVTTLVDAGAGGAPADAGPAAPPDAGPVASPGGDGVTVDVTGGKAEILLPGETKWTAVPAGAAALVPGAKLRLGARTTATLASGGATLELTGGSRVAVTPEGGFVIEAGVARARATAEHAVAVPGGVMLLRGSPSGASEARLEVGRETKISMLLGAGKLSGAPGSELEMRRGESASVQRSGVLRVLEAIPTYFDFRVTAGESFTVHDPRGATAVQFHFGGKCGGGGIVEMDRDARFRTAKLSAGKESANLLVGAGAWAYRLRCSAGGGEGQQVASGRVVVMRDAGSRKLPAKPAVNRMDTDGRNYRFDYQSVIPNIEVRFPGGGRSFRLHLAQGGKDETFDSTKPTLVVPGTRLKEGTYTYWFDRDGVKQPKVGQLVIGFDQTAAQVYIEAPPNARPWPADIDVRGATLPGWTATIGDIPIPIDKTTRRFGAKVPPPPGNALAIKLYHPQRGIHYYLRRAK